MRASGASGGRNKERKLDAGGRSEIRRRSRLSGEKRVNRWSPCGDPSATKTAIFPNLPPQRRIPDPANVGGRVGEREREREPSECGMVASWVGRGIILELY